MRLNSQVTSETFTKIEKQPTLKLDTDSDFTDSNSQSDSDNAPEDYEDH